MWEHLFEAPVGTRSLTQHLENMTAYCHLARTEYTDAQLRADGTLQREAQMCVHIREALAARTDSDGPVIAILGGFHAVAVPGQLADEVAPNDTPTIESPANAVLSEESAALIRYSFERLDQLNGYAAGMRSPAWYQRQLGATAKIQVQRQPKSPSGSRPLPFCSTSHSSFANVMGSHSPCPHWQPLTNRRCSSRHSADGTTGS